MSFTADPRFKDPVPGLVLTLEGEEDLRAPTLAEVGEAVEGLSPDQGCGFLILELYGRDYAQVAGGDGAYTVEWRDHPGGKFRHWVAGRLGAPSQKEVPIQTNCAAVMVRENERLSIEEVKAIVLAFVQQKPRPADFAWREITAQFL